MAQALASLSVGASVSQTFSEGAFTVSDRKEPAVDGLGDAIEAISVGAGHAALLTEEGRLLYGKNENERAGMASTTKIMTALLAAEYIETVGYDAETVVTAETAGIEGSSVYLKVGERVRLLDLLYATLLASANDGAATLALAVAGSLDAFVERMNERADALGLTNTHFENPHGLASDEHYTTAYELGLLAAHALQNELFATVCATRHYTFAGEGITRSLTNHNRMLFSYEGAIGVKTGFTRATGRCLVTAAEREGVKLIAVTLDAPDDWNDHRAMLDLGFSNLERVTLAACGELVFSLPVVGGQASTLDVENREALTAVLSKAHGAITCVIELPSFVYGGLTEGIAVGRARYYENGVEIGSVSLVAKADCPAVQYEKSVIEKLLSFFTFS